MREGWDGNTYLILFDGPGEAERITEAYGLKEYLPGYTLWALRNWDDFIVADAEQNFFLVPTVPLEPTQVAPCEFSIPGDLEPDARLENKIKWYLQPTVFDGDPEAPENLAWVPLDQHVELVRWWAKFYRDNFQQGTQAPDA